MQMLGAHMSIAGGHERAIAAALSFGMSACQIFTKNANQWNAKPIPLEAAELFRERYAASGLRAMVAHDSYLINLASPDDALWEKSRLALLNELDRCDQLGVPFLVSHPGGHVGSGVEAGIARVGRAINQIHRERPDGLSMILLETTAGQGTTLGRSFEEIASIIDLVDDTARVGVCLDTCHIFAAGYDIRDEASFQATVRAFDDTIGLDRLKVVHLNDSKKAFGSRVDRHAPIGEGEIGLVAFELFLNDPRFVGVPGILETPKGDDGEEDRRNLATLRGLSRLRAGAPAVAG
ncbi:MAG: deoxyribonuclease IV [Chloroflexota bacterium]|nr:deoxyribonuclease IV [Chloroflexota bacterium]